MKPVEFLSEVMTPPSEPAAPLTTTREFTLEPHELRVFKRLQERARRLSSELTIAKTRAQSVLEIAVERMELGPGEVRVLSAETGLIQHVWEQK